MIQILYRSYKSSSFYLIYINVAPAGAGRVVIIPFSATSAGAIILIIAISDVGVY